MHTNGGSDVNQGLDLQLGIVCLTLSPIDMIVLRAMLQRLYPEFLQAQLERCNGPEITPSWLLTSI